MATLQEVSVSTENIHNLADVAQINIEEQAGKKKEVKENSCLNDICNCAW